MKKLVLFIFVLSSCSVIYRLDTDRLRALGNGIRKEINSRLQAGFPMRNDGYCYAIDLAEIMQTGVEIDDSLMFAQAYEILKKHFIIRDSWLDSAILWRYKPGLMPDASGTAETIHCAYSIFLAYRKWKVEEFKNVSYSLAKAYIKHGTEIEPGKFLVKNYFNYATRTLSENTYLINQRPGALLEIGKSNNDSEMIKRAEEMYRAIIGGYIKNGFFHSIYDIGIKTVYPFASPYFSPNSIFPLISSLDIALAVYEFNQKPALEILQFMNDNIGNWRSFYFKRNAKFEALKTSENIALVEMAGIVEIYRRLPERYKSEYRKMVNYILNDLMPGLAERILKDGPEKINSFYFDMTRTLRAISNFIK